MDQHYYVTVEGNVGSCKSTICKLLADILDIELIPEGLENWRNVNGYNLLEALSNHSQADTVAFQNYALITALSSAEAAFHTAKSIVVSDRSIYSQKIFWEVIWDQQILEAKYIAQLNASFDLIENLNLTHVPNLIVYMRSAPEQCLRRVRARNRSEEYCYELSYLKKLHHYHEKWLLHPKDGVPEENIYVVEVDEILKSPGALMEQAKKLASYIKAKTVNWNSSSSQNM